MTFYERAVLGSSMTDRDLSDFEYTTDTLIFPEDGTEPFMCLGGGTDMPVSQIEIEEDLMVVNESSIDTGRTNVTSDGLLEEDGGTSFPNSTGAAWNISATDVRRHSAMWGKASANRAAFIHSLIKFINTNGFQGADIDWEYSSELKRGGRIEDAENVVRGAGWL
ncbi:uncharacterized protein CC84DRAFT_1223200 [Paraphaeosphaeria sporulosa]|uniref:GH18 domain-containing protein n=1 Tax=Paraphaeosphaeria sporulosa TaxID=1460663 RepID=A0A177BWK7_9PLEO|nr:uncharacterized protein CC84DRAFT_1223200 [Paraphaeosphaeria sporulosa]OAF98887.1 hypothetical protein CC84DRAFT_1223200 [Paraphaeosphaeria sporulosa]